MAANELHQAYFKYLIFMLFALLIHMFVLFPGQFKTYKLISLVFTVKGCCQEPPNTPSLAKIGRQNWHAAVMFRVFNHD